MTMEEQGLIDEKYKDANPLATVEKIQSILAEHGIEVEEQWTESSVPHCFSLRVKIKDTMFGTNGKGLTKEFALASAYAELMERMQLGHIGATENQKDGQLSADNGIGEWVDVDLLLEERHVYEKLSQQLYAATNKQLSPEQILKQYVNKEGKIAVLPVYNITRKRKGYFPKKIQKYVYGSNGSAAGNTMEEAIVQAIGEIVERAHQMTIRQKNIPIPEIPDEELQKFKTAYSIISYLREQGVRVIIKDCSLGGRFPVVCACYVNPKTGEYHTHFGANAILEIAIERALTESFQGRTLANFTNVRDFLHYDCDMLPVSVQHEELIYGVGPKRPGFFVDQPAEGWNSKVGFTGTNNKELLRELVDYFEKMGFDILVQNGSCMGFPTCRVLIPGFSEVLIYRLNARDNEETYADGARKAFRNPSKASMEDMMSTMLFTGLIAKYFSAKLQNKQFVSKAGLFAEISDEKGRFLKEATFGYIHYTMGNYQQALSCAKRMRESAACGDTEYLNCLTRYLEFMDNEYAPERVEEILRFFHCEDTVDGFYKDVREGNPFERFTLHCEINCTSECQLYGKCKQKTHERLIKMVAEKTEKMDFEQFVSAIEGALER